MVEISHYEVEERPSWCPGCGDFAVLNALRKAVVNLGIEPKDLLIVSGIGCSSNLPHFIKAYGFHGIHGRALPIATGAKLGNHELNVVVTAGDGDGYGIGLSHFIHTARRNIDITYIVMNNQIYGLTTGQTSPTSEKGFVSKSTPAGVIDLPVNPLALGLSAGATFVSRGFSGDPSHLSVLIEKGIRHKGFALVDVFSPCVTFNKRNTYEWFRARIYKLEESGHDVTSFEKAFEKAVEEGERIPIGLFYQVERSTYEEEEPVLRGGPLWKQKVGLEYEEAILQEFL